MPNFGQEYVVCGGRDFRDARSAYAFLGGFHKRRPIGVIIEGDAPGADRIAGFWARRNNITNIKFPADWLTYGRRAGPIRNEQMLRESKPDVIIMFPGGRGTAHMVSLAEQAGIEVIEAARHFMGKR